MEVFFCVTGPLWGEFTRDDRSIPPTKASDVQLWFIFYLRLKNGWINNQDAGDLGRHRAICNVTVMYDEHTNQSKTKPFTSCTEYTVIYYFIFTHSFPDFFARYTKDADSNQVEL